MAEFRMPSLGADMKKGTLVEWKVQAGDRVKRGDIIAEVETEKGIIEIEVFMDGVVEKFLAEPGDEVPVGEVIAMICTDGEGGTETAAGAPESAEPPEGQKPRPQPPETEMRLKVSPAARKKAAELGLDLTGVQGSGPDGAIRLEDVETAAAAEEAPKKRPARQTGTEAADFQAGMRRAIAKAMSRSNRDIPHYYLETRIDMSRAMKWLGEENQRRSVRDRLLSVVLLLKAAALALAEVPALNGFWIEDRHQPSQAVHVGFAIALRQGGLIAPAIHDTDRKTLDELMADVKDLIARTRAGKLKSSEMTDATATLTNLGDLGVETSYGLIYPPQVALVSFGRIMDQPWVENAMIGIRPVLSATLSGDHRATDGRTGARFLNALNLYLQEAEKL
ncbi:MAG: dihydrolipoamide acetyltransferase family protein [Thermodesulfobacteriota bacterium]